MQGKIRQDQPPRGCFYALQDYGSVSRRALALLVDTAVLLVVLVATSLIATALGLDADGEPVVGAAVALLFLYLYFVELERSPLGTIGLRLMGLEVVNLNGRRPSRMEMIARSSMAWLGPVNVLVDLFWIPADSNRQTLRDKFAGTYVIKKGCAPADHDQVRYGRYFFLGMNWAFREVARPQSRSQDPARPGGGR